MLRAVVLFLTLAIASPLLAQNASPEPPMTPDRLISILVTLDPAAVPVGSGVQLTVSDVPVMVFLDPVANRMRAIVPVASANGLTPEDMERILQANFDTALDARYAIANGRLWSAYIHPLRELEARQLISGIAQTVTLAQTYGSFYASGVTMFGGGDSNERFQELFNELLERGEAL